MVNRYRLAIWVLSSIFLVFSLFYFVSALSDTMAVEANIMAGSGSANDSGEVVRVEVPDYLFFGNVSVGGKSDELKVYINNTGNVDIRVTPELTTQSEDIFSYLYFRKFKTSNGSVVNFTRIGDYSIDISKPASGKTFNDEYFYVTLDLTKYQGTIVNNLVGHRAYVRFIAAKN